MESVLHISPVFTPGASGVGTLNFTGLTDSQGAAIDARDIHAVFNLTRGAVKIYGQEPGYGATNIVAGPIFTLVRDTVGFSSGDLLAVIGESSASGGGGGSSVDRELVVSTYVVKTAFSGASVGDTVTATQVIDVSGAPTTISTIWRNQTTAADFGSVPSGSNLTLVGSTALTDAQLRATPVPTADTAMGTDSSGVSQLSGGAGVRGWLSGIFNKLSNTLQVSGSAAVGSAPVNPPLSISGVDGGGLKRHILTGADGKVLVTPDLASGASSSALQTSQIAQLSAMIAKLPDLINGRQPVTARNGFTALSDSCVSLANFGVVGSLASGDILLAEGNAVSANYVVLSLDPLTANTESRVEYNATFNLPFRASLGISASQRTLGQELSIEFVDTGALQSAFTPKAISSIQQATTTLTVTTSVAHGLQVGQCVSIDGVTSDSRLNYPALVVATVPSSTSFTATAGPGGTIASVTAGPFSSGTVYARSRMGRANDGLSMILENATATSASVYTRADGGEALPNSSNANFIANHSSTIQSSASVVPISAQGVYCFQPTTKFEFIADPDYVRLMNKTMDGVAVQTQVCKREQVVPNPTLTYKLRFRANNNPGLTRPVAQITTASKAGSTTATVTTATPHGLTTGDLVNIYGSRDTTNFANLTTATAVASVIDANNFTLVWGASVTATSYGGYVSRVNGGTTQQGASTIVAQSISRTSNIVSVVGSATWTGAVIGDLINLIGIRDTSTGASLGLDGVYRVNNIATTTLTLEPIAGYAPTGADVGSVNCGGTFIKRTDLRVHSLKVFPYDRLMAEISGGNSLSATDIAQAISVAIVNAPTVTATGVAGAAAAGATASGNPVQIGTIGKTAQPTARTDGQIVPPLFSKVGHGITKLGQIRDLTTTAAQVTLTGTTETTIVAAVASTFNDLSALVVCSTASFSGSPTAVRLDIRDTTAGTVRLSIAIPLTPGIIPPIELPDALKQSTVNTNWTAQLVFVGGTSPAISSGDVRLSAHVFQNI